ncbi:hypothetical protein BDR03DRAFT_1014962 [Suillus americanus]|nr:hypothetical protein BDR03DRAFT_1014962 [Suillus americanus]
MPRPAMRPGNANKHPGQIVLEASAEKSAKAIALEDAQKKVTAMEDAMAVEQTAQRAGPGRLVRSKPKLRPVTKAALTANPDKTQEVEVGKWAKSVASKSQRKPSVPPSAHASVIASRDADISEDENLPEDHDESVTVSRGSQIIDSLDFGLPGYQTALALTTAAAERALILARDDLIVEDTSDHRKHKIALTLNQSTNKMSNTGTAFSAGNWETDTLAYMERIEELPFDRIKEIVEQSQAYMKHAHRKDESTILDGETPVNPRTHICI